MLNFQPSPTDVTALPTWPGDMPIATWPRVLRRIHSPGASGCCKEEGGPVLGDETGDQTRSHRQEKQRHYELPKRFRGIVPNLTDRNAPFAESWYWPRPCSRR